MFPQRRAPALVPLLAAVALLACPRPPVNFGKDGEARTPEELLKRIAQAEATVVALKGDGSLYVETPQGKGSVSLFVAVSHPALIHIEQLDFFNRPQGVLVTDGSNVGLYDAKDGKYYRGPATPANLGRFLPVVLPPAELAALMLGRAPRLPPESSELSFDDKLGVYVLTLKREGVTQTLHVQPPSHRVVKSTVTGRAAYDVEFSDIADYGAVTMPKKAKLLAASAKTTVELTWKDVTLNEPPDLTLFDLTPPEDVPVVDVDAQGSPVGP
ncbi:MAG: DUF4292 domain-containing protein [Myxococcota bacterium]